MRDWLLGKLHEMCGFYQAVRFVNATSVAGCRRLLISDGRAV
jgi:hypothetical protein